MKKIFTIAILVVAITSCSTKIFAQSESRDDLLKAIETKRSELSDLEKKFLAPSDEDLAAFAGFLKQDNTGLIRLLPRETYDFYGDKKERLTTRGGGSFYSFARLTHEYGQGSDLALEQGYLFVGFAGADFGMIGKIEDVGLEELSLEHPGVRSIATYAPTSEEPEARLEYQKFQSGVPLDGLIYKSRLPVVVGGTYILRSINYARADVLVAFRVVRKDIDGSLIIAWKLLKKYPKPQLARSNQ